MYPRLVFACLLILTMVRPAWAGRGVHAKPAVPVANNRVLAAHAPRPGALASAELQLVGLRLEPPAREGDVPLATPFVVKPLLKLGNREATPAERMRLIPADARLEAVLSGPSLTPATFTGTLDAGIAMPGLPQAGDYQVTGLRLVQGGKTLLDAGTIRIRCLGELIVSSVTSTPMTLQEIREAGIQTGPGSFEARRFTVALSMGSQSVNLTIPIARPIHNGLLDPRETPGFVGRLEITGAEGVGHIPDLSVSVVDMRPDETFALSRPELQPLVQHGFKSVVVIPGSIKFLKQFFKVNLLVLNVLPEGSPYVVRNLKAKASLPPGADGGVGTGDDPLKLVTGGEITDDLVKAVLGHNALGTPQDPQLKAGQTGSATWLMRGDREGKHLAQFHLEGEFSGGLLTGPIPIRGTARGTVLVQNPTFHLLLVHPDVVRRNEVYELEAQVTNTSQAIANSVELALDMARMAGVRLDLGETPSRTIDTLLPGQTASFRFRLRAMRNGEVVSTYQYYEDGLKGSLRLGVGLGERSVRLSSDTLLLPRTLDILPEYFRDPMLRVLGQAHSIATRKAGLPSGVLPISGFTVTKTLAQSLNEAGLFLRMGVPRTRVILDLWRAFTVNGDPGFDQLMRTTDAGRDLRDAFLRLLQEWRVDGTLGADIQSQASALLSGHVLAFVEGAEAGLSAGAACADGSLLEPATPRPLLSAPGMAMGSAGGNHFLQVPASRGAVRVWVSNPGTAPQSGTLTLLAPALRPEAKPRLLRFPFSLAPGGTGMVDLGLSEAPQWVTRIGAAAPTSTAPQENSEVAAEPFQVLAVHRWDLSLDPAASPYGTHVLVLFNRPNQPVALPSGDEGFLAGSAMVQVEENTLWRKVMPADSEGKIPPAPPAMVQALPRIVSIYLEKPVGPDIPRTLKLLSGWQSAQGEALSGLRTWPLRCGTVPGGAIVRGKVRTPDDKPLTGTFSYWYFTSREEGGVDLQTGLSFESLDEDYYALVSSEVPLGADGSYSIDFAPEPAKTAFGPLLITARTPAGSAFAQATVLGPNQTIEMDLVLEGKGRVFGKVTTAQGNPVVGADVQATQEQQTPGLTGSTRGVMQASTKTDAKGEYAIENLKTGVFSVRVMHGLLGAARSAEIARDGDAVAMDVVLDAPTVSIRARLLNVDGTPRVGQPVFLGIPAGLLRQGNQVRFIYPYSQNTDTDGYTTFSDVPAGDVAVVAMGQGSYQPAWFGYLKGGVTEQVVLQYKPARKVVDVTVEVQDSQGKAVSGAKVFWHQNGSGNGMSAPAGYTNASGTLTLPAPELEPYSVTVVHVDWAKVGQESSTLMPKAGESNRLLVRMPARSWAYGRVVRSGGSPVQGAIVAIPPVTKWVSRNRLVLTDAQGYYRLPGLSVTEGQRLAVVGPELRTAKNQMVQGLAESGVEVNVVLPEVGRNVLFGHVWQPQEGTAKTGAMATVEVRSQLPNVLVSGEEETEASGNYEFGLPQEVLVDTLLSLADGSYRTTRDLPSGPYRLNAWNEFFPTRASVSGTLLGPAEIRERDITLVSTFAGALEGRVYEPDGCTRAKKGVRVILRGGSLGSDGLNVECQADGTFAFPRVIPAGEYALLAEDPVTGARVAESVFLEKEINRFRSLRLLGRGTLTVRVQDASGRPLTSGNVLLDHNLLPVLGAPHFPEMSGTASEANQGVFVFEELWEGLVTLELRLAALRGAASVEIPQGGGNVEVVVRLQPSGGITGLLKRADGSKVAAGRVDVYLGGKWFGVSNSNVGSESGRFKFQGLPAGTATLQAYDPDSRQVGSATVQIPESGEAVTEIVCLDKGAVSVLVTRDGKPVNRASVLMRYRGGPANIVQAEATTGADGKAGFTLPPGEWQVEATDPITLATGSIRFMRVNNQGAIAQELRLAELRTLNVTVIPPPGHSGNLSGWRLRSDNGRTVMLQAGGKAVLPDMMVGRVRIHLQDESVRARGSRDASLTVEGANDQYVQLRALARGHVEIQVKTASGQPAALADVSLNPSDGKHNTLGTSMEGVARFPSELQGVHGITARDRVTGMSVGADVLIEREDESTRVELTLGATGSLQGTLTEAGGTPVPFNPVWVRGDGGGGAKELATDAAGRFHAENLPLGSYSVWSSLQGRNRSGSRRVVLSKPDEPVDASFTLSAAGTLVGTVVDPLRSDPGTVNLVLTGPGGFRQQLTVETDGSFRFSDVPSGQAMTLTGVMDDGFTAAGTRSVQVPAEGSAHLDFLLEPRPHLSGRTLTWLKDPVDGKPYEAHKSMTVYLHEAASGREVRRSASSVGFPQYQMNYVQPGVLYRITGYDGQALVAQSSLTLNATEERQVLNLYTIPTRTLTVRLLKADGSILPLQGRIDVLSRRPGGGAWVGSLASGQGDVADVATGPVLVRLSNVLGQPVMESGEIQVIEGPTPLVVDFKAQPTGSLRVQVSTQAGRALSGSRLVARTDGSPLWEGVRQADGTWLLEGVWIQKSVWFELTGFGLTAASPRVTLQETGQVLDVKLTQPDQGTLTGRVQDASGKPAKGLAIYLNGSGSPSATTDASGAFTLPPVAVGSHVLKANLPGHPEYGEGTGVLAKDGDSASVSIRLLGQGSVEVLVADPNDQPIVGQAVELHTSGWGHPILRVNTVSTGIARFDAVVEGSFTAKALVRGLWVEGIGSLQAGGLSQVRLTARPLTRVTGRVRRATPGLDFPRGTLLQVRDQKIPMAVDGTLMPANGALVLPDPDVPAPVLLLVPQAPVVDLGRVNLVANGDTVLDLQAPAFGMVEVTAMNEVGWRLEGAQVQGAGLSGGLTDGLGVWRGYRLLSKDASLNTCAITVTLNALWGRGSVTLMDEASPARLELTLQDAPEVHGVFTAGSRRYEIFQDGAQLWIEGFDGTSRLASAKAALSGLQGTGTYGGGSTSGSMTCSFGLDLSTFQATLKDAKTGAVQTWSGVRQKLVAVKVLPETAVVATEGTQTFRALVAGTPDSTVEWSSDAGSMTSLGAFTAPAGACTATITARSCAVTPCVTGQAAVEVRLPGVYVTPTAVVLDQGETMDFRAMVVGLASTGVRWTATPGSIDEATGRFTAPDVAGPCTIQATSLVDASKTGQATAEIRALSIRVEPATAIVNQGGTQAFRALLTGTKHVGVNWETDPPAAVDGSGLWTAPAAVGTYTVRARSARDTKKVGEARITVPEVSITVSPSTATLTAGGKLGFTARVSGATDTRVTWEPSEGTVDPAGVYTAPLLPVGVDRATATLTARSIWDTKKTATATLTVEERPQVLITAPERALAGATGMEATVAQGTGWHYLWRVEGGTLTSPPNDPKIRFDAGTGTHLVLHCHVTNPKGLVAYGSAIVPLQNGKYDGAILTVAQALKGSQGLTAQVPPVPGATYVWTLTGALPGGEGRQPFLRFSTPEAGTAHLACRITTPAGLEITLRKDVPVLEGWDVSGRFTLNGKGFVTLFQEGTTVSGVWTPASGAPRNLQGAMNGPALEGTWTEGPGKEGALNLLFSTYGDHFTGTWREGATGPDQPWSGDRLPELAVRVIPTSAILPTGGGMAFAADVAGSPNKAVFWTATAGQVSDGGWYGAPGDPGTFQVIAAAQAEVARKASATVSVGREALLDVAGTFTGGGATLVLDQFGDRLEATWTFSDGRASRTVSGRIQGAQFTGTWLNSDGSEAGGLQMAFSADGSAFSGVWTSEQGASQSWSANRSSAIRVAIDPAEPYLTPGEVRTFRASVAGLAVKDVAWSATGGSIDKEAGTFTAPAEPGTCQITATSVKDGSKKATITVQVKPKGITILPAAVTLSQGGRQLFKVGMAGLAGGVDWTADGIPFADGRFRAPDKGGIVLVKATNQVDKTFSGEAQVMVRDVEVAVLPATVKVLQGETVTFRATVTGTHRTDVTWKVEPAQAGQPNGTMSDLGVLTAPPKATSLVVTATSVADPTKFSTAMVTVPPIVVKVIPGRMILPIQESWTFSATVENHANKGVTWSASKGVIDPISGRFTAPSAAGEVQVRATSVADSTIWAESTVTVVSGDSKESLRLHLPLDEGIGTAASDRSAKGNHGTYTGVLTWAKGRDGRLAADFADLNSAVAVPDAASLNPQSLTISMWVYLKEPLDCDGNNNYRSLIHKGLVAVTPTGFDVVLEQNGSLMWDTGHNTCDRWMPSNLQIPLQRWVHVALTYDENTGQKQAFLDGALMDTRTGTGAAPLAPNTNPLVLNYANPSLCPSGEGHAPVQLSDVKLFDRALMPSEVAKVFGPARIQPRTASVKAGGTQAFSATAADGGTISWSASAGVMDSQGVWTAPSKAGRYRIFAAAGSDPEHPDSVEVEVYEFDAGLDFKDATNPNGSWSYGWTQGASGSFTGMKSHVASSSSGLSPTQSWSEPSGWPIQWKDNVTAQGRVLGSHPSNSGQFSVTRWTAPATGTFDVDATFAYGHANTESEGLILHNGKTLFSSPVNARKKTAAFSRQIEVTAGDTLDAVVGWGSNANYNWDYTYLTFAIKRAPGLMMIVPAALTLAPGASFTFTATGADAVQWTLREGTAAGSIQSNGLYTAPSTPGVYRVVATDSADVSRTAAATVTVMPSSPEGSLVLHLPLDEGQGNQAQDRSASANHGAYQGAMSWGKGPRGRTVALFDDRLSMVTVPDHAALNPKGITVSFWINLREPIDGDDGNNWRSLLHKGALSVNTTGYAVVLEQDGTLTWDTGIGRRDRWMPSNLALSLAVGRWAHVVLTYDGATGTKQAFLDGAPVEVRLGSASAPLVTANGPLYLNHANGALLSEGSGHVPAALSDLKIYDRALLPQEVMAVFGTARISPRAAFLKQGGNQAFSVQSSEAVTLAASQGAVSPSGIYQAPARAGTYRIQARRLDGTVVDEIPVYVYEHDLAMDMTTGANPSGPWSYGVMGSFTGAFSALAGPPVIEGPNSFYWGTKNDYVLVGSNVSPARTDGARSAWMHPANDARVTAGRWIAPSDGRYQVTLGSGSLNSLAISEVQLRANGASRWNAILLRTPQGLDHREVLDLKAGDRVDALLGRGDGSNSNDSTRLDFDIRCLDGAPTLTIAPLIHRLSPGSAVAFTAALTGLAEKNLDWEVVEGSRGGSVDGSGRYTAPLEPGTYHVKVASAVDASISATATLLVSDSSNMGPDVHLALDEGSGTVARNQGALTSIQGTLVDGPTWIEGKDGSALHTGTSNGRILLSPSYRLPKSWTIATWFQAPLPNTSTWHTLTRGASGDHQIIIGQDQQSIGSYDNSAGMFRDAAIRLYHLAPGWHHLATVGEGGTTRFFVDGQPAGKVIPWQSTTDVTSVGNYLSGSQAWGPLDGFRIYPRALDALEIATLASDRAPVVTPAMVRLDLGASQSFQVTGIQDPVWSVAEAWGGTIDKTGLYTASHRPGTYRVIVESAADSARRAEAAILVLGDETTPDVHFPMDEGTGTVVRNAFGGDPTKGTLEGSRWVAGRYGSGVEFQGYYDVLRLSPHVAVGSTWTLATWVKTPFPKTGGGHDLFHDPSGDTHINISGPQDDRLGAWSGSAFKFYDCGVSLSTLPAGWHHITAVGQGGQTTFFVDGQRFGDAIPFQCSAPVASIGNHVNYGHYAGTMDDVRIYRRALTPEQIMRLAGRELVITPSMVDMAPGASRFFSAYLAGRPAAGVTWTLWETDGGTLDPDGRYTAPGKEGLFGIMAKGPEGQTATAVVRVTNVSGQLDAHWSFNEGQGLLAQDASGKGRHGQLAGGASWTEGRSGKAVAMSAVGSKVAVPRLSPFTGAFSISAWVKFNVLNKGNDNVIVGHGMASPNQGLHFAERGSKPYFGFYSNDLAGTTSLTAGQWTHLVGTFDGTTRRIFVNGRLDAQGTSGVYQSTLENLELGRYPWNTWSGGPSTNQLDGALDEVRVYSRALEPSEVAVLAGVDPTPVRARVDLDVSTAHVYGGTSRTFQARVTGLEDQRVTWSLLGGTTNSQGQNTAGTLDQGRYTAGLTPGTYQVVATAVGDSNLSAKAVVTVSVVKVTLSPGSLTLLPGGTHTFSATVTGALDPAIGWKADRGRIIGGIYTAPDTDGPDTVTAYSAALPSAQAVAQVNVKSTADLLLRVLSADGKPMAGRTLSATAQGSAPRVLAVDGEGKVLLTGLLTSKPVTLIDLGGVAGDPWQPSFPEQQLSSFKDGDTVTLTVPVTPLTIRIRKSYERIPGVELTLSIGGKPHPFLTGQTTDLWGEWTLPQAPLGQAIRIQGLKAVGTQNVTAQWDVTPDVAMGYVRLDWPTGVDVPLQVFRANGEEWDLASGNGWTARLLPGDEFGPILLPNSGGGAAGPSRSKPLATVSGPKPALQGITMEGLPSGVSQTLDFKAQQDPFPDTLVWGAQATFTPGPESTPVTLRLPVLAALRLELRDKAGKPLVPTGEVWNTITVASVESPNGSLAHWSESFGWDHPPLGRKPSRGETSGASLSLPEIFLGGRHVLKVDSSLWGPLGIFTVDIASTEDGAIHLLPIPIDMVTAKVRVAVVAGDGESPIETPRISFKKDGEIVPDSGEWKVEREYVASDTDRYEMTITGKRGSTLQVEAEFWLEWADATFTGMVECTLDDTVDVKVTLPLTVVRARLTDPAGVSLDTQVVDFIEEPVPYGYSPWGSDALIAGVPWLVVYGVEPGPAKARLSDLSSGLGHDLSLTVPPVGERVEQVLSLPPYLSLRSLDFRPTGPAPATHFLVGVTADAPGVVYPAWANWWLSPEGWRELSDAAFVHLETERKPVKASFVWEPSAVNPAVRVPQGAQLWLAEGRYDSATKTFHLEGRLGRATLPTGLASGTVVEGLPVMELPAWTWVEGPIRVDTPGGAPFGKLVARPQGAPAGWHFPMPAPDAAGVFLPLLPVGQSVVLQTFPDGCGVWYFGKALLTPVEPKPLSPFILQAGERREVECPPPPVAPSGPPGDSLHRPEPPARGSRRTGGRPWKR